MTPLYKVWPILIQVISPGPALGFVTRGRHDFFATALVHGYIDASWL
jgi:hypothetical protein